MIDTLNLCSRAALTTAVLGATLAGAGTASAAPLALSPSTPGTTTTTTPSTATSSLSAQVVGPFIGQLQCELQTVMTTTTYWWDPSTETCALYVPPAV